MRDEGGKDRDTTSKWKSTSPWKGHYFNAKARFAGAPFGEKGRRWVEGRAGGE